MTDTEIIEYCKSKAENGTYIEFENEIFESLTKEQAQLIAKELGGKVFIKLPQSEIQYFEWLKENDPKIWDDLWLSDEYEPYLVGAALLPVLISDCGRGFPICDLLNNDNYYFNIAMMSDEESKVSIETAQTRFMNKDNLSTSQLLALEISIEPIDVWRFAYKYKISVDEAKAAVHVLVEDQSLVHLTSAEHLAHLIQI